MAEKKKSSAKKKKASEEASEMESRIMRVSMTKDEFKKFDEGETHSNNGVRTKKGSLSALPDIEEISEIIRENQLDFMSVDNIIKSIKGLLTDKGVYALKRILSINTDINIEIKMSEFSVEKILSMLSIESDELTSTMKLIIVYNLLIYLNRDKAIVIYINEEIDDVLANWINKTSVSSKNVYFLINSMNYNSEILFDEILLLTNKKELRKTIINKSECEEIIYALSSWTIKNISFQKEKIVNYYKDFYNSDFSVLLKIEE